MANINTVNTHVAIDHYYSQSRRTMSVVNKLLREVEVMLHQNALKPQQIKRLQYLTGKKNVPLCNVLLLIAKLMNNALRNENAIFRNIAKIERQKPLPQAQTQQQEDQQEEWSELASPEIYEKLKIFCFKASVSKIPFVATNNLPYDNETDLENINILQLYTG